MTDTGHPPKTQFELCDAAEVDVGAVIKVERHGLELAVFNIDGEFFVTDDHCTHGPGSLSEGFIEGDIVECNFHGGQFNIRTGAVVLPPCVTPVKTYPAVVRDGKVIIEV
jgi:nitrite reductase/ring-hydroxylating ferredoxin subunit